MSAGEWAVATSYEVIPTTSTETVASFYLQLSEKLIINDDK